MDASTLLTLAQSILQFLDSSFVKELGSIWGFHSQVAKIRHTMTTVNSVLLDAEEQERQLLSISNVEHDWLEKLRDVVYEADDLFDEIASVAHRKKLMYGGKLSKEVRIFFSRFNQFTSAFNASREVKKIRERLDDIAKDHRDFGHRPLVSGEGRIATKRREESHSFVHVEDVIGRDADKKAVLDMVLDSRVQEDVHFIAIVGIGGLGKTTLAQLVYNDETVMREFPLRLWVCVSDEFDIKTLLCKFLESTANREVEMEELQRQVRGKINGKKFFLVLDDVWNEDRHYWIKLRDFLIGGKRGSRVVVTTRSKMVARIVGDGLTYELKGLSEEDSWHLFERMAFKNDEERLNVDLVYIGKSILRKCSNVPLAIRIMGSLLYGRGKTSGYHSEIWTLQK